MKEKKLAFVLIRDGVLNQAKNPDGYTEANENILIKNIRRTSVARMLEFLRKKKIVSDYLSTFGEQGHGFAFRLYSGIKDQLYCNELIWQKVNDLFNPHQEVMSALTELTVTYSKQELNPLYKEDLLRNLEELKICFNNSCYIACLALCEQIREIALMKAIDDNKKKFDYEWLLKDPHLANYFDQPLTEKAIVIDKHRTVARRKVRLSIPTQNEAAAEIQGVIDTLKSIMGQ